jgi:hypothetical protein
MTEEWGSDKERIIETVDRFIELNVVPDEVVNEVEALHETGNSWEALSVILEAFR